MVERKRNFVQVLLVIACTTLLAFIGSAERVFSAVTNTYVLSEQHQYHLVPILETERQGKLDHRLDFQGAKIVKDHLVVRYGKGKGGETLFEVTLQHPSFADGAAATMHAFAIHEIAGLIDPDALIALTDRLKYLHASDFWITHRQIDDQGHHQGPTSVGNEPENIDQQIQKEIRRIRQAFQVDEVDDALRMMTQLSANRQTRLSSGLDLVELWWELGQKDKAINALSKWHQEAQPSKSLIVKLRARALMGMERDIDIIVSDLQASGELCNGAHVARSIAATGQTQRARKFVRALIDQRDCFDVLHLQIQWLLADGEAEQADRLSLVLLEKGKNVRTWHKRARSLRARVLMRLKRPRQVVDILEELASKHPENAILSSLLKAYDHVTDSQWKQAKKAALGERLAGNPQDHIAGLLLGILLHQDGKFVESDQILRPLRTIFTHQPELYLYLGMNALNQDKPSKAIEFAEMTSSLDIAEANIYYLRAEIFRWSKPERALQNLYRYLALCQQESTCKSAKEARSTKMAQRLALCIRNQAPIPCPGPWEHPKGHQANSVSGQGSQAHRGESSPSRFWMMMLVTVVLVFGAFIWSRRRKR
jgi:tetratricopeptide (TPR) repeat protein